MKKLALLLMCAVLVLTAMPFALAEGAYQKTITIAPSLDFTSMELQKESGGTAKSVYVLVYNTLIEYDTMNQSLVPGLAVSWEQVDASTWELKLREGVKFHDGSDFTAADVKFTYDHGQDYSPFTTKLTAVEGVEVVDDYTIRFNMKSADSDLLYKLCEPNISILSEDAFANMDIMDAWQIGTGPFKYNEWVQGDHLSLVRFDEYWGGAVNTEEIVIKWIPEAAARLIALQTGEIDICIDPPATDLHYVVEDENLKLWEIPSSNIRHIFLNLNVEPFTDPLVRQAVAHAIDREALIEFVYSGYATPAVNVMHPTLAGAYYNDEIEYYEYDLDKAMALMEEAGYADGFSTTIFSSSGSVQKAVDNVIQALLAEINIDVKIEALETATFNAGVGHGGTYPMAVDGWGGHTMGPDYALRSTFYTTGSINRSNVEDPYVDEMLDKALASTDEEERLAIYKELQQYMMDMANWIPLAVEQINACMKANLEGFELPLGLHHHWRNVCIPLA